MVRTPKPVTAACALLAAAALTISGCETSGGKTGTAATGATTETRANAAGDDASTRATSHFGTAYRFHTGLVVTVSNPTSFRPSKAAYPPADNAVAFEITVRNETDHRYRLSAMSITATTNNRQARQLTDPTQGYTGLTGPPKGLPTECETRLNLAFAVPGRAPGLKLTVSPYSSEAVSVTYVGSGRGSSGLAR